MPLTLVWSIFSVNALACRCGDAGSRRLRAEVAISKALFTDPAKNTPYIFLSSKTADADVRSSRPVGTT
eukprot:23681-Eustigmatos_ZCMA.PRE.1